uniref:Exopolygalacturonase-like n=1 Tax=Ananas comosus var. bracteatus TaxID=296719 RepID=A0A6V7NNZ9_ANACO|nr:unnamed protein product [Ananas comosus var. bracteatus]
METKLLVLLYLIFHGLRIVDGVRPTGPGNFNVMSFGARGDGLHDDSKAFQETWKAACNSTGSVKLVIPKGPTFSALLSSGAMCKCAIHHSPIAGNAKGNDRSEQIQGSLAWPHNKCPVKKDCKLLPTSLAFLATNHSKMKDITSVNSKFFHIALLSNANFKASGIKIVAPAESPNTDGIHLERNTAVTISKSEIRTGDDCISVGQGNHDITIAGIKCGPGHGISVGSLGKYEDEEDVTGLVVKDCTLTGTDNGVRIKTWENSPKSTKASNLTFENIEMDNVRNPIIIDQTYCPFAKCQSAVPSRVKISDITFKNIRGTSTSPVAVTLKCSKGIPCENVSLQDVRLEHNGPNGTTATCVNVKAEYSGTQNPPPCKGPDSEN